MKLPTEIARLKGLKGRPSIKPSGMEDATGPKRGGKRVKRRRRGKVTPRVIPIRLNIDTCPVPMPD